MVSALAIAALPAWNTLALPLAGSADEFDRLAGTVNTLLERQEAVEMVDEARRQLDQLIAANRSDRSVMLERELLDYEAIFRDIDDRAAEDLLRTLRDALDRIMDEVGPQVDV